MATTNLSFSAAIDDWCNRQVPETLKGIRDEAAEIVSDKMRDYTPIVTGFLAGTIQGTLNAPTTIDPSATNKAGATMSADAGAGPISLVIKSAALSDTIYICFTMAYAGFVEYGTSKMAPRAMVRRASAEWQTIVTQVVSRAKQAAQAGR